MTTWIFSKFLVYGKSEQPWQYTPRSSVSWGDAIWGKHRMGVFQGGQLCSEMKVQKQSEIINILKYGIWYKLYMANLKFAINKEILHKQLSFKY